MPLVIVEWKSRHFWLRTVTSAVDPVFSNRRIAWRKPVRVNRLFLYYQYADPWVDEPLEDYFHKKNHPGSSKTGTKQSRSGLTFHPVLVSLFHSGRLVIFSIVHILWVPHTIVQFQCNFHSKFRRWYDGPIWVDLYELGGNGDALISFSFLQFIDFTTNGKKSGIGGKISNLNPHPWKAQLDDCYPTGMIRDDAFPGKLWAAA